MARARTNPSIAGGNAPVFGTIAPPPRRRKTKTTLPADVLTALAGAITSSDWIGDASMFFDGDDGQKNASNEARLYRRDLSRHMEIAERDVRTRVWETEDGWQFALRLREKDGGGDN
jgi:hypothetical protein